MQAEFRPPHRRCRVFEQHEAPLPLSRSPGESRHFRAHLINQQVVLFHPEQVRRVHGQVSSRLPGPLHSSGSFDDGPQAKPEVLCGLLVVSLQGYFGKGVLSRARPNHCFADQWQRELKSLVYDVTTSSSASQLTSMFVSQSTKVFHFLS